MPGIILSIFRLFLSICLYNLTISAMDNQPPPPPPPPPLPIRIVIAGNSYTPPPSPPPSPPPPPPPYRPVMAGNSYPSPNGPLNVGTGYTPSNGEVMLSNGYPPSNVEVMAGTGYTPPKIDCGNFNGKILCVLYAPNGVQPVAVTILDPSTKSNYEESNTSNQQPDNTVDRNCGLGLTSQTPFVHYGTPVSTGIFPWVVALHTKPCRGGQFFCGGSLVSARTVITAAHCFGHSQLTKYDVELHFGRRNLNDDNEEFQKRDIQNLIIHPEYLQHVTDADIAIVQFSEPVGFSDRIKPICLWSGLTDLDELVGKKGSVAGWGLDENGRLANILKMVNADIVDENTCIRQYGYNVGSRTLCAGNLDGSGPCVGDSGSAFMIQRDGRWLLRGIVSAGHKYNNGQCNQNFYVLYCDVAKHLRWVQQNIIY